MASRLDDPAEADRLIEAIAKGGMKAGEAVFDVDRVTLWRWRQDAAPELRARVAAALAEFQGRLSRADSAPAGRSDAVRGVVAAELVSVLEMREIEGAQPKSPVAEEGGPLELCASPVSRTGRMTPDELQDHIEYAVRHPDHPFAQFAIKILVEQHFGQALIRSRRQAEAEPTETVRQKVLREPVKHPDPEPVP